MATAAAVTCLAWLGLVELVLVACQGQGPWNPNPPLPPNPPIPTPTEPLLPGQPPAFVITGQSPVREVFCRRRGPREFVFSEPTPGAGELTVRVLCPRRGYLNIRLPAPADFQAELVSGSPSLPNFGPLERFTTLPRSQQDRMIAVHNFQRSMVTPTAQKMFQLRFDIDLARQADQWVARCVEGLEGSGMGENVAKLPGRVPMEKALDVAFENWMQNPISERQVLVDEGKYMGCSYNDKCRDFSGDFTLVACYYEKRDQNPSEQYPYITGPSCAQCSECLNRLCLP